MTEDKISLASLFLRLQEQSVEIVDKIFEIDWVILDDGTKKGLITIVRRATIPIELTSAYIFTMDLNTFVSVSKQLHFKGRGRVGLKVPFFL